MKKSVFLLVIAALTLAGCATHDVATVTANGYGFWYGLWHGLIAPLSLIGHLFDASIQVYQTPNNGGWYDFGFLLGVGAYATAR